MWIFCCGMRRSGSTLHYNLTCELVNKTQAGQIIGWADDKSFPEIYEHHKNESGLLVIKCHEFIDQASDLIDSGQAKGVYVYRDLRDVIVSSMNVNEQTFEWVLRKGYLESLLNSYHLWTQQKNMLISCYKDLMQDVPHEVMRIARFLGLEIEETLANTIADKYSLKKQKERMADIATHKSSHAQDQARDPETLLLKNHIHSGKRKQWQQKLSSLQIAIVEGIAGNWLTEQGYHLSQPWGLRQVAGIGYKAWKSTFLAKQRLRALKMSMGSSRKPLESSETPTR